MLTFLPTHKNKEETFSTPNVSEQNPQQFFLSVAKKIKTENESERARYEAQDIFVMCCRHRGRTPNDNFGFWREGVYCTSPAFATLHGTNVFQMLIRAAEANFNQIDIKLDITANRNNSQTRAVVKIAKRIYEILKERQWTETAKQSAFYANILMLNAFYISRFDKSKGIELPFPDYEQVAYEEGGTFVCSECYASGEFSSVQEYACPECGGETLSVIDDPVQTQDYLIAGFNTKKTGETEMIVADGLDVSVDPDGKPSDISSCRWVEWRYLAQKSELKRLFPHLSLTAKSEWSYQTRLKMGLKRYTNGESYPDSPFDKQTYEVRQIWLDLTEYESYVSPVDWKLGNFAVQAGIPLGKQHPNGIVIGVTGQELAFCDDENKNKRVSASLWLSDGVSFSGLGAKSGLLIQKKINHLDNMAMEGEARSLKGSMLYNPLAVDGAMLEGANTNIPLRPDYVMDGQGFNNVAFPVKVDGLSQESLIFLASQKQTMQEVMGVPDVALGQDTSTDKTFGGQALRSRNAAGLLIPAAQSQARAMELWFSGQLDIIQNFYAPEGLKEFGAEYGEEWTQDEIEAFYSADFDRDILIAYRPGSEIAESRFDRQQRLRADIAAGFVQLTPEIQAQLAGESGYEGFDSGNYESNRKLADKRYDYLNENLTPPDEQEFLLQETYLIDPVTGMKLTDETGNPLPNPVVQRILAIPELAILKEIENHPQMVEFWGDKARNLAASINKQSPLLIAVCVQMVNRHNQAIFELSMKNRTLAGLAGAPTALGNKMLMDNGEKDAGQAKNTNN